MTYRSHFIGPAKGNSYAQVKIKQGPNTDHWITTAVNRPGRSRQATIRTMDDGCNCLHGKLLSDSSVSPHRP